MKPYFWAILAALAWGVAPILEKFGLSKVPVFPGLIFRSLGVFIGAVLLLIFQFDAIKGALIKIPQGWEFLAAGGIMASIIGQIFFYHALKNGEASLVVPLGASYPLITFILGVIFLQESITVPKIAGIFFVMLGVFFLK